MELAEHFVLEEGQSTNNIRGIPLHFQFRYSRLEIHLRGRVVEEDFARWTSGVSHEADPDEVFMDVELAGSLCDELLEFLHVVIVDILRRLDDKDNV